MGKDTPPYRLFVRAKDIKLIPAVRSRDREAHGEQTYRAANGHFDCVSPSPCGGSVIEAVNRLIYGGNGTWKYGD
ncbi:hypothetical protein [Bacillus sp. FSL K6-6540]|uniref:hypothetical protein n=1 Tax=Bacillus sp. FSL K6-6540 TaxID=2921512 RepID=UPI0030FAD955